MPEPVAEARPTPTSNPTGENSDEPSLDSLVTDYFRQPAADARKKLAVQIEELVGGDVDSVADALGRVQVWSPQAAGQQRIQVHMGEDRVTDVIVRVPPGYDHTRRYPLILALHGLNGRGEGIIGYLRHVLGERLDEFIVAAPTDYKGHWFNSPLDESGDPTALLADLRRRYHLDTRRVYAVGYSMGGHAAFTLAIFHTDEFAAVVPVAGTFVVPWSSQAFALLLPNVNNLPVLAVWGEKDTGDDKRKVAPGGGIAGHNRRIRALAAELNLPIRAIELKGIGHGNATPPNDLLNTFLDMRREGNPREFVHWFRYPAQGRAGWVRQIRYAGIPWQGTQISVATTGRMDVDRYVTDVFKKKLAYVSGQIDGQRIQVEIRKTAELEVLLNDELVDLDEPIILVVGDKKRYKGQVRRKVATLLETAYRDWDFQRLYPVRLVMRARSKARQE
ncbi:MAG: hypothetical protein GY778_13955 [bacterium]|nr:hypothetical protein [bacterium]